MINTLLTLDNKCLGSSMQLVEVTPNLYANGQRLENPNGYKYSVCLREHRNDKLSVTILGTQMMDTPSTMADVFVSFDNLVVRPYVDRNGRLAFTASASGIHTAKRPELNVSAAPQSASAGKA